MLNHFKTAAFVGLAAATVALSASTSAAPLRTWYGHYVWEENLGRIGGSNAKDGVVAFTTYTLTLGPSAGPTGCALNGEGFQLYQQLKCTATPEIDSVVLKYFALRAPYKYPPGARLFTITRTSRGLITHLQALRPSSDATAPVGRLFHYRP